MSAPDEPSTRVTLGKVYDLVLELKDELSGVPARVTDHEVRLRVLEKYFWLWLGGAGAVGGIVGAILTAAATRTLGL